jgi:hypothetical protein
VPLKKQKPLITVVYLQFVRGWGIEALEVLRHPESLFSVAIIEKA